MNFPIFSASTEFSGFQKDPFFIDSKNSETSSHLTLPSTGESANFWFLSGGAPRYRPFASGPEAAAQTPAHNIRRDTVADEAGVEGVAGHRQRWCYGL